MSANVVPVAVGARQARLDAGGLLLTEARYSADHNLPPHAHRNPVLTFVLDGRVRERWGSRHETYRPMSLIAIPAGQEHHETFPPPGTRCLIIEVGDEQAETIRSFSAILEQHTCVRGASLAGLALQLCREIRSPDDVAPLAIEGLVLQLAALAERRRARSTDRREPLWLRRVRDAIHSGYAAPLRMNGLAAEAGVHPVYLARAFRDHYGCSPSDYVRRLRVVSAAEAMARSRAPLARIALESGFYDQSHFSREFRKVMGTSPGRFREATRSRE